MTLLVVELTYDPPLTPEQRQRDQEKLYPCLELRGAAWLRSYESTDRRRKICLFRAPDADALREALRSAGLAFDRLWAAAEREPDPADPTGTCVRETR